MDELGRTDVVSFSVYFHKPPMYSFLSNPVTSKPSSSKFFAATSPRAPAQSVSFRSRDITFLNRPKPMTATELPVIVTETRAIDVFGECHLI
jgi:hypothetical protein